jgi:hypothetical protein
MRANPLAVGLRAVSRGGVFGLLVSYMLIDLAGPLEIYRKLFSQLTHRRFSHHLPQLTVMKLLVQAQTGANRCKHFQNLGRLQSCSAPGLLCADIGRKDGGVWLLALRWGSLGADFDTGVNGRSIRQVALSRGWDWTGIYGVQQRAA